MPHGYTKKNRKRAKNDLVCSEHTVQAKVCSHYSSHLKWPHFIWTKLNCLFQFSSVQFSSDKMRLNALYERYVTDHRDHPIRREKSLHTGIDKLWDNWHTFLQTRCPSSDIANSMKALKGIWQNNNKLWKSLKLNKTTKNKFAIPAIKSTRANIRYEHLIA